MSRRPLRPVVAGALRGLARTRLPHTRDLAEVAAIYEHLSDPAARAAIRHVVRSVIDWRGQVVTMTDRAYLTRLMPMCVVWGQDDDVIPVDHAANAEAYAPGAEVHVLPDAAHFPHRDHPDRFAQILTDFVASTRPATHQRERWRQLMDEGLAGPVGRAVGRRLCLRSADAARWPGGPRRRAQADRLPARTHPGADLPGARLPQGGMGARGAGPGGGAPPGGVPGR